ISFSDRELARAFRPPPRVRMELVRKDGEPVREIHAPRDDRKQLEPPPKSAPSGEFASYPAHVRVATWAIVGLAVYGLYWLLAAAIANAGTCWNLGSGQDTVTACEDGSFTVTDPDGHKRVYGEPNGGFEKYPGQPKAPVYERREKE